AARDREASDAAARIQRQARQNRALRAALASAAVLVVLVAAALVVAFVQRGRANARERAAETDRRIALAATRVADARRRPAQPGRRATSQSELALLLAAEAYRLDPSVEGEAALITTLEARPQVVRYLPARGGVLDLAASGDGRTLAAADEAGGPELWS